MQRASELNKSKCLYTNKYISKRGNLTQILLFEIINRLLKRDKNKKGFIIKVSFLKYCLFRQTN